MSMQKNFHGRVLVMLAAIFFLASMGSLLAQESFTGEVVQAPGQTIAPGQAELIISLDMPQGMS